MSRRLRYLGLSTWRQTPLDCSLPSSSSKFLLLQAVLCTIYKYTARLHTIFYSLISSGARQGVEGFYTYDIDAKCCICVLFLEISLRKLLCRLQLFIA